MANAYLATQVTAKLPTRIGLLADVCAAVAGAGVNIDAISAYERDGEGKFLLITSDAVKTREALQAISAEVTEKRVLAVGMSDQPGQLAEATRRIAEAGINIEYVFGSSGQEALGPEAMLVMSTSDDERALDLL